jgi:hypothetical protein
MAITFETETVVKHHTYIRIGKRRVKLDREIDRIEQMINRWESGRYAKPELCLGWVPEGSYLEARGVLHYHVEEVEAEFVTPFPPRNARSLDDVGKTVITTPNITSMDDVKACLAELKDTLARFQQPSTKTKVRH